jgi:hypothetical protein
LLDERSFIQLLEAANVRLDQWPDMVSTDQHTARQLATWIKADAQECEEAILRKIPEDLLLTDIFPDVVRWALIIDRILPTEVCELLPVTLGVAQGLFRAEDTLRRLKLRSWLWAREHSELDMKTSTEPILEIAELWHQLRVITALPYDYEVERLGRLRRLERYVERHPDSWIQSLPWILTVGPTLNGLDVAVTLMLMDRHPEAANALRDLTNNRENRAGDRARGIETIASGGDLRGAQDLLLDAAAKLLDRRRQFFPHPLGAPSATWLSDLTVESMIRGASQHAVEQFADVIKAEGAAEEEGLTQNLLSILHTQLNSVNPTLSIATLNGQSPKLSVARRTVPKSEERTIGADLGILAIVELPGHARVRFGDLIQVKKSKLLLRNSRSPLSSADSWRIDIPQLETLLSLSATSVYWLITRDGNVHAVPAKILLALSRGHGKPGAGSFTCHYRDIRHAAITLGQYLCDMLLGMWTGSTNPTTLAVVDGSNGETHPRNLLTVTVQVASQG